MNNREQLLLRVEKILHSIYNSVKSYPTQQEVADAVKILKEAEYQIANPKIDVTNIQKPAVNLNTKGRKPNTKRLDILLEIHEDNQKKNSRSKKKKKNKKKNMKRKKDNSKSKNYLLTLN